MYNNQLDDILFANGKPHPGICAIKVVDKNDIASMPSYKSIMESVTLGTEFSISEVELKPSKEWYTILNDFNLRASLKISSKDTVQGAPLFTYELAFDFPNDTSARSNYLRKYDQSEMILFVTFKNNTTIIIGNTDRGADFSTDYTSGNSFAGSNKFDAAFVIQTSRRHFYVVA